MLDQPPDLTLLPDDLEIWRYMDFTKFVALLHLKALFFTRADQFDDPFEGSLSHINLKTLQDNTSQVYNESQRYVFARLPHFMFVNCWHANDHESAAMWRLYLSAREGVAIQSTVGRLKAAIAAYPQTIVIGEVRYIDYDKEKVPTNSLIMPFLRKRKSFEHEREVRALFHDIRIYEDKANRTLHINLEEPENGPGVNVPISVPDLINRVIVAPTAPQWFQELVDSMMPLFGFDLEVRQSRLDDPRIR